MTSATAPIGDYIGQTGVVESIVGSIETNDMGERIAVTDVVVNIVGRRDMGFGSESALDWVIVPPGGIVVVETGDTVTPQAVIAQW